MFIVLQATPVLGITQNNEETRGDWLKIAAKGGDWCRNGTNYWSRFWHRIKAEYVGTKTISKYNLYQTKAGQIIIKSNNGKISIPTDYAIK